MDYSQQGESHFRNRGLDDPAADFIYHGKSDVVRMLNARLGWQKQAWSLEFYGLNLLDENGFVGPFVLDELSARPRPRTIGLNLGYQF